MAVKKKVKKKKAAPKKKIKSRLKKAKPAKTKKSKPRKSVKTKASAKKQIVAEGSLMGKVTHYFPHVKAGALIIQTGELAIGDVIRIKGHTTDFKQKISSMQIDRKPVEKAAKGDEIGILVKSRVRIHDKVYKI